MIDVQLAEAAVCFALATIAFLLPAGAAFFLLLREITH